MSDDTTMTSDRVQSPDAAGTELLDLASTEAGSLIPRMVGMPEGAGVAWKATQAAVSELRQVTSKAKEAHDRLVADDVSNPAGVKRQMNELRQSAPGEVAEAAGRAEVAVVLLEASLVAAAVPTPTLPPAEQALRRDELRMMLDAADDPVEAMGVIAEGADRELAAIVAGSWGKAYLVSRRLPASAEDLLRLKAMAGSAKWGTPAQRAAVERLADVAKVKRVVGLAQGGASLRLQGIGAR